MRKNIWISGFIFLAGASFMTGMIIDHPRRTESIHFLEYRKLYEMHLSNESQDQRQNQSKNNNKSLSRSVSYEKTQTYTSKDGRTSTTVTHGQNQGMQYQIIETQSSDPSMFKNQNQKQGQGQSQTEADQRMQIAEDMNQEINSTMASINQFNQNLEPGLMIPQAKS